MMEQLGASVTDMCAGPRGAAAIPVHGPFIHLQAADGGFQGAREGKDHHCQAHQV